MIIPFLVGFLMAVMALDISNVFACLFSIVPNIGPVFTCEVVDSRFMYARNFDGIGLVKTYDGKLYSCKPLNGHALPDSAVWDYCTLFASSSFCAHNRPK